jgi:phenylacetic acid degradation operon negative regulatory protein
MARRRQYDDIVSRLLRRLKPKAKSVIITVYGDSIVHHGGSAWLGSLIKLVAPLGLNERVVRTSVFRLAKEDWLVAEQIGRRSFYRLTETGRRHFDAAYGRIYYHASRPWDRHWTIVITNFAGMNKDPRKALHNDLRWQGFGQLANGIMLHPDPDEAPLRQTLIDAGAGKQVVVMRTTAESWVAAEALRDVINRCWDMKRLAVDYTMFLDTFRPVWQTLSTASDLDPKTCFAVRTLLMHAYRRVLLRDPKLPDELLEANWPGTSARLLCRNLYRLIQASAEQHLMAELETADGAAPEAHPIYYTRFGGLETSIEAV